ncbi:MAG: hypothetical protein J6Y94_00680, partial [Bacteriovoracaceae bacterium]|nr:hypothetical protein [Bacteriovoracaceae bacterium]
AATWPNDRKNKIGALNIKIQRIIPGPRNADSPVLSPSNLQINFEHLSSAGQDKLVINILIKELHQNICMPRPREFIAMFNEKFPEAQNLGIAFDLDGFVQQRKIDLRAKTQGRSASYDWQSVADELRQQAETSTGEISDLWDRPEKIIFQPVNSGIPDRIFSPGYLYAILIFPGGDTAIIMIPGMGVKALNYRGTAGPIVGTYVPTENKVINDQYLQTLAEELAKLSKAAIRNGLIGIKLGRQNMTNTPIITSNGYFTSSMVLADDTFTAEKINEIIQTSPEKISEAAQAAAKKISKIIQTSAEINLRRAIPASDNIPDQLITDVLEIILQDPQGDFKNLPITDLATGLLLHRYGQGIEEDQALRNYNCQDEHELTHKITTILRIVKSWQQSPRLSNYGVTRGGLITLDLRTSSMRDLEYHLSYPNQDGTIIDQTIPLRLQGPEDEELEKTIFFINRLHVLLPKDDQSFTPDQLEKLNKIQKIVINVVELVEANTRKRLKTTFEILEDGKSIQINLKLYRSRVSQTLVLQDILNQITVKQDPVTQDYTLEMIPE